MKYNKKEIREMLETKSIPFDWMEHEAVYTMEDMDRLGITAKGIVCKNLFLRDVKGKNHFLVCVPEEKKVDLKTLHEKIGCTKLSFASAERLKKYLGVEQGCVSPFGVLQDEEKNVTVIFDQDMKGQKQIGVHPNDNTATVWLPFVDLCWIIEGNGNQIKVLEFFEL